MLKELAYYNGSWGAPGELKVPLEDRGYLFGEGVYEAVLAYNQVLWGAEDHLDRLERSLRMMEMSMPLPRADLLALIEQGVAQVGGHTQLVYLQVSRGDCGPRNHHYLNVIDRSVLMMTIRDFPDPQSMEQGESAILYPDSRWLHCDIKTLNLIPNTMAATAAARVGAYTAIFHRDGMVTEGASYSAFIAREGRLITRPLSPLILPSITRAHVLRYAAQWGLEVEEAEYSVAELLAADEVMLCSATRHPVPIVQVDGQLIGNGQVGPLAKKMFRCYEDEIIKVCGPRPSR